MKINLIMDVEDILPSYLNVSPYIKEEGKYTKCCDIKNLDDFLDDGEAEEIVAYRVLRHLKFSEVPQIISHWAKKLKRGGKLVIEEVDIQNVCREFAYRRMDLEELNEILFGSKPHLTNKSVVRMPDICKLVGELGMKVETKRLQGNYLVVVGVRV